jgi:hypothetical protein
MENTGLITYREAALLIDANSSVAMKQRVAQVVSHELSHQVSEAHKSDQELTPQRIYT